MACGLPAVASDVGGVPEIVVPGETGSLATPGDEEEMAERAIALLRAPETMGRFGRAARERARTQFSLDEQAKRTSALLRRLAREATRPRDSAGVRPTLASDRAGPALAR
jgi:glycosyltransferase involved in cell wall biosynthesis